MKMVTSFRFKTFGSIKSLLTIALFGSMVLSGFNANALKENTSTEMAPLTGCTVPMSLSVGSFTATTVNVTWPFVPGAGWFVFEYRIVGAPSWTAGGSAGAAATAKTISGLTASTNYEVRGRIFCSGSPSSSAWSTPVTFTTLALAGCELPPVITASAITGTTFTLTWPAVTGAGWYSFRYKETTSAVWIDGGTSGGATTSKNFIGFTPNTSYNVEARTHCAVGGAISAYSSIIVTTPDVPTSSVLAGTATICIGESTPLTVTITNGTSPFTVVYKINAVYTTVSGYISGSNITVTPTVSGTYELVSVTDANGYLGIGNAGTATITVNTPAVPVTPGTYTDVEVIADGGTADFASSCDIIGSITDLPGGNVIGSTSMQVVLATTVVSTNFNGYNIGRRYYTMAPTSDGSAIVKMYFTQADFDDYNANSVGALLLPTSGNNADPNKNHFRLITTTGLPYPTAPLGADLNWDGTYWVLTTSLASVNNGFYFTTQPDCIGINVTGLGVTSVTAASVSVSWTSVVTNPPFGDYSFQYREVGAPSWISGGSANNAATTKTIFGLTPGLNYEIQIRRNCSSQSSGPWSASVSFTTLSTGCGTPMVITSPVTSTANSATVNWTSVAGVSFYDLRYKATASGTWISAGTATSAATSKIITGLSASTNYEVQGRTNCPNGAASAWSASELFTTPAAAGCALAPSLTISDITALGATANWAAVAGAGWYEFQYKETSSPTWIFGGTASGAATSKIFNTLNALTNYDLQARTYCPNGVPSAWSSTAMFTTGPGAMIVEEQDKYISIDVADKGLSSSAILGVYPNPVVDIVNIAVAFDNADENATIKLMDMNGRIVREMKTISTEGLNTFEMNLSELSSGLYTVFVYSNNALLMTSKVKKN